MLQAFAPLKKYLWKYRWRLLAGVFFVISANALNSYTPIITGSAVNLISQKITQAAQQTLPNGASTISVGKEIVMLFLKYLLVALLAGGFTFMMRQTIIVVSRRIECDMKADIYDHYQRLDLAFYRKNNTGDLMNRITEDVSRVRMFIGPAVMYGVNLLFSIIFCVSYMLMLNKTLTLYVLIPLPVLAFLIYYLNDKIESAGSRIQAKLSDLTTFAQETYSGIRVVQAYACERTMLSSFVEESEKYRRLQLKLAKLDALYFPVMTFLVGVSIVIVIWIGGIQVGIGNTQIGTLTSFLAYVNMLMWPVSSLGWTASLIQRAAASQKRINEFLNTKPAIIDSGVLSTRFAGDIVFDNVSFTYPDTGIVALRSVSFHIRAGQKVAIIGKTGSGKSTIADLLLRLYDVTSGEIRIDGKPISHYTLGALRSQIGYVPQDVFLFSETIAGNISFGVPFASDELIHASARIASVDSEVERFPSRYETIVGERGVTLSGGQKQRISIARALIKDPRILILDDSLSAVDAATEKQIQNNLNQALQNRTTIIISHRIFSLIHFDQIFVLENGNISERGTHEELLAFDGIYASVYRKQLQEPEASLP